MAFWKLHKDKIIGALLGILISWLGVSTGTAQKIGAALGLNPPAATSQP